MLNRWRHDMKSFARSPSFFRFAGEQSVLLDDTFQVSFTRRLLGASYARLRYRVDSSARFVFPEIEPFVFPEDFSIARSKE